VLFITVPLWNSYFLEFLQIARTRTGIPLTQHLIWFGTSGSKDNAVDGHGHGLHGAI